MNLPDEFQGLPLDAEDEAQLSALEEGNRTVHLSAEAVEGIRLRIAELSEIVRQNALVALPDPDSEGESDAD